MRSALCQVLLVHPSEEESDDSLASRKRKSHCRKNEAKIFLLVQFCTAHERLRFGRGLYKSFFRLSEMLRSVRLGHEHEESCAKLRELVARNSELPAGNTTVRLQAAQYMLAAQRQEQDKLKVRKWQTKLTGSVKECFRWLRTPPCTPPFRLTSLSLPGESSQDPASALELLTRRWRRVWDREVNWEVGLRAFRSQVPASRGKAEGLTTGQEMRWQSCPKRFYALSPNFTTFALGLANLQRLGGNLGRSTCLRKD